MYDDVSRTIEEIFKFATHNSLMLTLLSIILLYKRTFGRHVEKITSISTKRIDNFVTHYILIGKID